MTDVNWAKGIDPKTGKPIDYDPAKEIQTYAGGRQNFRTLCPSMGNNFVPPSYSQHTKPLYIPVQSNCVTDNPEGIARITAVDPLKGEIKKTVQLRRSNFSGTLATGGGLVFTTSLDGTFAAYDHTTLEELFEFNVGASLSAPPMTYEVNGKQYVAIVSGSVGRKPPVTPNAANLFVFGL